MIKRAIALTTAAAIVAVPTTLLVAAPANADVERQGSCGEGRYELSADREGNGYEVNVDLDYLTAGSTWRVVIKQDGKIKYNAVRTAERDGDIDVERYFTNSAGKDTFRFKATRVGSAGSCGAAVTFR